MTAQQYAGPKGLHAMFNNPAVVMFEAWKREHGLTKPEDDRKAKEPFARRVAQGWPL